MCLGEFQKIRHPHLGSSGPKRFVLRFLGGRTHIHLPRATLVQSRPGPPKSAPPPKTSSTFRINPPPRLRCPKLFEEHCVFASEIIAFSYIAQQGAKDPPRASMENKVPRILQEPRWKTKWSPKPTRVLPETSSELFHCDFGAHKLGNIFKSLVFLLQGGPRQGAKPFR